jgi:predicted RNA-binding protein with PIN domain
VAEGEGFEPPGPCGPAVFKTAAIDHSATPPDRARKFRLPVGDCRAFLRPLGQLMSGGPHPSPICRSAFSAWPSAVPPCATRGTGHAARVAFEKHLLVDGANLLHAWPELRALLRRDRDSARAQLVRQLGSIHDAEQVRVTAVFDGRGTELIIETPQGESCVTFRVLYTSSNLTADDVIEQLVGRAADAGLYYVATGDQAERQTVAALGATVVSPEELAQWVARAEQRLTAHVSGLRRRNEQAWKRQVAPS